MFQNNISQSRVNNKKKSIRNNNKSRSSSLKKLKRILVTQMWKKRLKLSHLLKYNIHLQKTTKIHGVFLPRPNCLLMKSWSSNRMSPRSKANPKRLLPPLTKTLKWILTISGQLRMRSLKTYQNRPRKSQQLIKAMWDMQTLKISWRISTRKSEGEGQISVCLK